MATIKDILKSKKSRKNVRKIFLMGLIFVIILLFMAGCLVNNPKTPEDSTTNIKSITFTYNEDVYELFKTKAKPDDILLFFNSQFKRRYSNWIDKVSELKEGRIGLIWSSWKEAKKYESQWAPYIDVFAYDIEGDSPPDEIANVTKTINELKTYLGSLSCSYNKTIYLSVALNYRFGSLYNVELARADEVHIHANALLHIYPEKDKQGLNYVEWAVKQAEIVRKANPKVKIRFAVLAKGATALDGEKAAIVARDLTEEMKKRNMDFNGFTTWGEREAVESFLEHFDEK